MKKNCSMVRGIALLVLAVGFCFGTALAQTEFEIPEGVPTLSPPILVTTCGQSPGALMVTLICEDVGLECEEADLITVEELEALCESGGDCPIGNLDAPYCTLFVTTGTSLKGLGAAGIDIDAEIERCEELIGFAKRLGIVVIIGQVEGGSRRTDEYDEKSIRSMSPLADLLITRSDVDNDGYFTTLAEETGIPQIFINQTIELKELLPLLFPSEEPTEET